MASTQPISFSGFNGFDFTQVINSILTQESQPMIETQAKQQAAQTKGTALAQLGTYIDKLETTVGSLVNGNAFTGVAASSSDETTVKTTLGDGAIPGHYDLSIDHLARAQVTTATNGYATPTDTAADGGSISFTINGTTTDPINITDTTTLAQLKDLINEQGSGVVASIVNDGTNKRLVLAGRHTGEDNGFTINDSLTNSAGAAPAFAVGQDEAHGNTQDAKNASFTLNGLTIDSASNTVTDAIPGVTVTLIKAGDASVDVAEDYSALKGSLTTLVSDYNHLRSFYNAQSTTDPSTGKPMPLANDSIMRQALTDIRSTLLASSSNGGAYTYLSQVGLEFTQSGDLSFKESTFNTAMDSQSVDVKKLFQGTSTTTGVFNTLNTRLQSVDSKSGIIKTTKDNLKTTLANYVDQIAAQQMRLDQRRTELTKLYAAADQAMSQLSQQTSSLSSIAGR